MPFGKEDFMKDVKNLKIAYIGGGSRGWAWQLMRDLLIEDDIAGTVALYDIDYEAAKRNEAIGGKIADIAEYYDIKTGEKIENPDRKEMNWKFCACREIGEALTDADFVVVSILPGTLDEMHSDVHTPEKYGIYQPVGDSTGPGGIIRALRTIPMYEVIANAIKQYCPKAWVINYTNPMTVCVRTLYKTFPEIKAFGCCHEVFGTQNFLRKVLEEMRGIKDVSRSEIITNVIGVNHFTWITRATYKDIDLFPVYREFVEKYGAGYQKGGDENWANSSFKTTEKVKMDLFSRYGAIAAAGDRHLSEFNPGYHYLHDVDQVEKYWQYKLTSVDSRKKELNERLKESDGYFNETKKFGIWPSGEEGVIQMKALLGMGDLVTNVNIPNYGQIPNLPLGAVVETNAAFRCDTVEPVFAGAVPAGIDALVLRIVQEQELIAEAGAERDLDKAFRAFVADPLVTIPMDQARKLFDEMVDNTKAYLTEYFK